MLKGLCLALAILSSGAAVRAEDVLYVYNWNNYISDETVARFEAHCGCRLRQDFYSDNEEMLAKLEAGAVGYDLLVPTGNAVESLVRRGALREMDKSMLANLANLKPEFREPWFDPGARYSVPYSTSITLLGYSVHERDTARWAAAKAVIICANPYWAAFSNGTYIKDLAIGNIWVAHGYSNDMFRAREDALAKRPFTVGFTTPKEGAVFAVDGFVLHKSGRRPDSAHRFIDFMMEGRNAAARPARTGTGIGDGSPDPSPKPVPAKVR